MLEPFDMRLVRFVIDAAFCFVMVVITFIDLDHKLILNKVTIPSIVHLLRRLAARCPSGAGRTASSARRSATACRG